MRRAAGIRLGVDLSGLRSLEGPVPLRDLQKMTPLREPEELVDLRDLDGLRGLNRLRFVV